ncbi:hypothetical protein L3V83_15805, partial [Thiotrichales bacterium 19X7-9]|nr:hypothetical protein [Thiotrichales bacterium 19X7-9]
DTQDVVITINGTNDSTTISGSINSTTSEDDSDYNLDLLANALDVDLTDILTIDNVILTNTNDNGGVTLNTNGTSLDITPSYYDYLAVGESVILEYSYDIIERDDENNLLGSHSTTAIITINGANDEPEFTLQFGDSIEAILTETDTTLITSGTLTITDLDITDTVNGSVNSTVGVVGNLGTITVPELLTMFNLSNNPILDSVNTTAQFSWDFNSGSKTFDHLAIGESLVLTYT